MKALVDLNPDNKRYHSHLVGMLTTCPFQELQQPELAIESAKKVIEIGDDYGWIWGELALAQILAHQFDDAKASLDTAREKVGPNAELAAIELLDLIEAMLRVELGETDEARKLFERATQVIDTTTNRRWFTPQYRIAKERLQLRLKAEIKQSN